ncbi:hypothetical protein BGX31_010442 [Mortierella sp. GBA43]|nr:hypothetical protein BGX31_010442 [Mortierella sp. GBA43]
MDTHNLNAPRPGTVPGTGTASASGSGSGSGTTGTSGTTPHSSSSPYDPMQHRRTKAPHFAHGHGLGLGIPSPSMSLGRPPFKHWDDSEFRNPMESSGMKRTASYSSFLAKNPFYKPTMQHARAMSGQIPQPNIYSTPADPPTTLTKTPTYEYYGFVLYLVSGLTFGK